MEIRLIIGLRNATYELIVNPIVDIGFGYGPPSASDRWVIKTIIGYAFPVPAPVRTILPLSGRRIRWHILQCALSNVEQRRCNTAGRELLRQHFLITRLNALAERFLS